MKNTAGFIIKSQDKILICHPFGALWGNGEWSLPKGKIEPGETAIEAAKRETQEETGLDLNSCSGKVFFLGNFKYQDKDKCIYVFLFLSDDDLTKFNLYCPSKIKRGKNKNKPEIDLFKWVNKKEAKNKLHPASAEAIDKIQDYENE